MTVAAIAFDFDGVIIESVDIKTNAFARLFASEPEPARYAIQAFHLANGGMSRFDKFEHIHREILHRPLPAAEAARLAERFATLVFEAVVDCPFVPGALDFVERRAAEMPLFVVSATPEDELVRIVERRGLSGFFSALRGSPRSKAVNLAEVVALSGFDPAEVLMVGDGRQDHDAAMAVGTPFIGRVPPGHPSPFPPGTRCVGDLDALAREWASTDYRRSGQ
jgi:phosphoglycolate phosphatase-like HAD superfamily hydrolase